MPALNAPNRTEADDPDLTGTLGKQVNYSPFSGPTGSPFDAKKANPATPPSDNTFPAVYIAATDNYSTGALNTGIGFGCILNIGATAPQSIKDSGFSDGYTPGTTLPNGTQITNTNTNPLYGAVLTCIGGGRSTANISSVVDPTHIPAISQPYNAQPLVNMGNGGARNAGAGPAFTGFASKMVTAAADIAAGAAIIEAGFVNRTGATLLSGYSTDGSATVASPAVA